MLSVLATQTLLVYHLVFMSVIKSWVIEDASRLIWWAFALLLLMVLGLSMQLFHCQIKTVYQLITCNCATALKRVKPSRIKNKLIYNYNSHMWPIYFHKSSFVDYFLLKVVQILGSFLHRLTAVIAIIQAVGDCRIVKISFASRESPWKVVSITSQVCNSVFTCNTNDIVYLHNVISKFIEVAMVEGRGVW